MGFTGLGKSDCAFPARITDIMTTMYTTVIFFVQIKE
jgi:hypothetical protein